MVMAPTAVSPPKRDRLLLKLIFKPYALSYARIYILGIVFVMIVMGMNPFITTQGFAKFSMITTVMGAVCNIILDPILIFGFEMGVQGAAIARLLLKLIFKRLSVLSMTKVEIPRARQGRMIPGSSFRSGSVRRSMVFSW